MDTDRFEVVSRSLTASRSRRTALAALLSGPLGLLGFAETNAKKGKCKKPKTPAINPPPTCAQLCGETADFCARRADAPTLCIQGLLANCRVSCSSDQDCLLTSLGEFLTPYCVTALTDRNTSVTTPVTDALFCPTANGPGVCFLFAPPER